MRNIFKLLPLTCVLIFNSCGGSHTESDEFFMESNVSSEDKGRIDAEKVFGTLPDRKLILSLIEKNRLEYNPDLLNDPYQINTYTLEFLKAINLGIYGTDLNVANSFDQSQECMVFLKCVNSLAGHLGVGAAFDQTMFDRIEANKEDRDSVMTIVRGAFKKMDEILNTNNRPDVSATVLSGCWIEGLYISCKMADESNSKSIVAAILNQKESLDGLIEVLQGVKLNNNTKFVLDSLKDIQKDFVSIAAKNDTNYNNKTIESISKKVTILRNKIVNSDSITVG